MPTQSTDLSAPVECLPRVDLTAFDGSVFAAAGKLSAGLQQRCANLGALPLAINFGEPVLAIANAKEGKRIRDALRGAFRSEPRLLLAAPDAIERFRPRFEASVEPAASVASTATDPAVPPPVIGEEATPGSDSDAPVVRLVNRILGKAIACRASDVHFEPFEGHYRVRMRRDGVLTEVETPEASLSAAISARIKVMARMDIAERRLPQDGRIRLGSSDGRQIDLRVNSLPTLWGEKLVLRILGGGDEARSLADIGLSTAQKSMFEAALSKPQGLILVTGPTGSGKTGTLYAGLKWLNDSERNILAVEDPVEITLPGVNQVQVNARIGLTFASVLRAFLRQDPDIIMLGEIRDQETAEIAVRAAQTGHIVLATLHTNSALETPSRLVDIGVPAYLIAGALNLVVAQRLLRRLCRHCGVPAVNGHPEGHPEKRPEGRVEDPKGCEHCLGGYSGRVGVFEMLSMSPRLGEAVSRQVGAQDLTRLAREEGMSSLREQGLALVSAGLTSAREVERVCQ